MLTGAILEKMSPDIDFTDEEVVQFDVPVGETDFRSIVVDRWSQMNFDVNT